MSKAVGGIYQSNSSKKNYKHVFELDNGDSFMLPLGDTKIRTLTKEEAVQQGNVAFEGHVLFAPSKEMTFISQ